MIREEFLSDGYVQGFVRFLSNTKDTWIVSYDSGYQKITEHLRRFRAHGIESALQQYCWPSSFTTVDGEFVDPRIGIRIPPGVLVATLHWSETKGPFNIWALA
jgi:hypothetical protein